MHGTEGEAHTYVQIGVHQTVGRRVEGVLEGAEAEWLLGDADVGLQG